MDTEGTATVPTPGLPGAGDFYAGGGPGPGTDQADSARRSLMTGLFAGAVGQGRPPADTRDVRSPQQFPNRPSITEAVDPLAVGDETAMVSLPGRVPVAAWDGEPGQAAPNAPGDY